MEVLATTIVFIRGLERHAQAGMVQRHVLVRLAACLRFEIDSQAAVQQEWMTRNVFDIAPCHRIDGVDQVLRLM